MTFTVYGACLNLYGCMTGVYVCICVYTLTTLYYINISYQIKSI